MITGAELDLYAVRFAWLDQWHPVKLGSSARQRHAVVIGVDGTPEIVKARVTYERPGELKAHCDHNGKHRWTSSGTYYMAYGERGAVPAAEAYVAQIWGRKP
jgi:hypothetical protein